MIISKSSCQTIKLYISTFYNVQNPILSISIISGKNFIPPLDPCQLVIVGTLESKETLSSEPVNFYNDTPEFNTELAWTMSRQTFQALRGRRGRLKVEIYFNSNKKLLGHHLFDLREAIPKKDIDENESYIVHASERKLKCPETLPGRSCPSIRAALIIEPCEPDFNEEDKVIVT